MRVGLPTRDGHADRAARGSLQRLWTCRVARRKRYFRDKLFRPVDGAIGVCRATGETVRANKVFLTSVQIDCGGRDDETRSPACWRSSNLRRLRKTFHARILVPTHRRYTTGMSIVHVAVAIDHEPLKCGTFVRLTFSADSDKLLVPGLAVTNVHLGYERK